MRYLILPFLLLCGFLSAQSVSIKPGTGIAPVETPNIRLDFDTAVGKHYQIESSEDLLVWKHEGYAFPGIGGRMSAMVSNHGKSLLFYRVDDEGLLEDIAPLNPYGLSAPGAQVRGSSTSWDDVTGKPTTLSGLGLEVGTSELMRELGASGFNSLAAENQHIWRLVEKINRERSGHGSIARDRFRSVSFGDSVATRINNQASGFWGYGGGDANLLSFISEASPVPETRTLAAYSDWSSGVFSLLDEWHRTPGGLLVHLDASLEGAGYVEKTNWSGPMHSVVVTYMARKSSGPLDESYGRFALQYKPNNEGGWIECDSATVATGKGFAEGGIVLTDNDSAVESIGRAVFHLPSSDTYAIRLVVKTGRVRLTKVLFNNGGLDEGPAHQVQLGGSIDANFALGGRGIASHFSKMTQQGLNDALGYLDPHVVVYKSANEWSLSRYETYWPELAAKIMMAAPSATLIVAGSHPQNALRDHFDEPAIEVDDFLREWCAETPGAIFVDVRQNFPEFQEGFEGSTESIDDLWQDGVHIGGKGEHVVSQLVWDAIEPAFQYAKIVQPSTSNSSNILPMVPTEIRLFDQRAISNRTNKLALTVHPRAPSSLMFRSSDAPYFPGNQSWRYESGLWVRASTDVYPSALSLFSDGQTALTFGHHQVLHVMQGLAVGISESHSVNAARAADGYRFRVVNPVYGKRNGLIVEGRTDSPTDTRLLGIDVDSSDQAAGTSLWSWMEDGTVIHEGSTVDENQITLNFENPVTDVTITTPAKTGVIGVVPAYSDKAAAVTAGLTPGDNYWETSSGKLKTILP